MSLYQTLVDILSDDDAENTAHNEPGKPAASKSADSGIYFWPEPETRNLREILTGSPDTGSAAPPSDAITLAEDCGDDTAADTSGVIDWGEPDSLGAAIAADDSDRPNASPGKAGTNAPTVPRVNSDVHPSRCNHPAALIAAPMSPQCFALNAAIEARLATTDAAEIAALRGNVEQIIADPTSRRFTRAHAQVLLADFPASA